MIKIIDHYIFIYFSQATAEANNLAAVAAAKDLYNKKMEGVSENMKCISNSPLAV